MRIVLVRQVANVVREIFSLNKQKVWRAKTLSTTTTATTMATVHRNFSLTLKDESCDSNIEDQRVACVSPSDADSSSRSDYPCLPNTIKRTCH